MGYRSDVVAVFYTYDHDEFPAIKLFIDENIPAWFKDDEYMSTFEGQQSTLHGIKFSLSDVKWYESYPDVKGFEEAVRKFEKLSDGGREWLWEFVRVGEEIEDIENKASDHAEGLLRVVRSIEFDF
jgi:hypothetical protein